MEYLDFQSWEILVQRGFQVNNGSKLDTTSANGPIVRSRVIDHEYFIMTLCHGNFGFVMLSKLGRLLIAACIPKGGRVEGARSPVERHFLLVSDFTWTRPFCVKTVEFKQLNNKINKNTQKESRSIDRSNKYPRTWNKGQNTPVTTPLASTILPILRRQRTPFQKTH